MNSSELLERELQRDLAQKRLNAFAKRWGQVGLDLAYHAAFPLALTPELLYCLRENFVRSCPPLGVADLLLSALCGPVGYELYEMDGLLRNLLLRRLKEDKHFGEERLYQLAAFMEAYIHHQLRTQQNHRAKQELGAEPYWTALAYIRPGEAVWEIERALQAALAKGDATERVRLVALIESYEDLLRDAGLEPVLTVAREWETGGGQESLSTFSFETVRVNRRGEEVARETHQARYFTEDLGQGVTLEMVCIPGGTFWMGSPEGEGYDDEKPQHSVTVPAFFMAKYPVTQAQWRAVAALPQVERSLEADPARFKGDNRPVEQVSWFDAVEFCARLSRKVGREYALPSEALWEYACRAGTTTPFYFGETITTQLANYDGNSTYAEEPKGEYREETTPVGSFPPNAFGLYDMHGNVYEWCLDDWHDSYEGAPTDGSAWLSENDNLSQKPNNSKAILRGGSWIYYPINCRSAYRNDDIVLERGDLDNYIGFRVASVAGRTFNP